MGDGTRELKVLGEFKPFGLIAEGAYGETCSNSSSSDDYDYFLFSSEKLRTIEAGEDVGDAAPASGGKTDNELFIRGKRITWSAGARVLKRFTLRSKVVMACWCCCGTSEKLLCVLLPDSLTIYNVSGEVTSIPLPRRITSIWPLPYGLLLQQDVEGNPSLQSSSCYSSSYRQTNSNKRESSSMSRLNFGSSAQNHAIHPSESSCFSSHLFLKDILEEPELTYKDELGRLGIMRDFDEKTVWTSDQIPLMVSYNKEKLQHSLWIAEIISPEAEINCSSVPGNLIPKKISFRRIWQGKVSQIRASKVFLANDDDGTPVTCFLLEEQKKLLSVRLESLEINNEIVYDVKSDMSWTISAVSAVPVSVTRPGVKVGLLPYTDIFVTTPEGSLYLYCGKQCLCKYLPSWSFRRHILHDSEPFSSIGCSDQVLGLIDAVEGRVNITLNDGKIFRCELQKRTSSPLVHYCITALAEGLSLQPYNNFLLHYWRGCDSNNIEMADSSVSEWETFSSTLLQMCSNSIMISATGSTSVRSSSWDFLIKSRFHRQYRGHHLSIEPSDINFYETCLSYDVDAILEKEKSSGKLLTRALLEEILDSLHMLYETLKLDILRNKDLKALALLLCNLSKFVGEGGYVEYYIRDFPSMCNKFGAQAIVSVERSPPSLLKWLENCLRYGYSSYVNDLPPLILKERSIAVNRARMLVGFYSLLCGATLMGHKLSSGVYCKVASGSHSSPEELTVLAMVGENFGVKQLDYLPSGVSLPLRHALDKCRECPPTDWPAAAYILVGRQELAMSRMTNSLLSTKVENLFNGYLTSMSTPYLQQLHPVIIPTMACESIGVEGAKPGEIDSTDGPLIDGMEHIFSTYTRMRYGRDLRLNEVRRLLCSSRPVAIQVSVNPSGSEQDAQQDQLWQVAQRTTALPLGRGAFTLATVQTILTEVFTVPKLVLAGRLPAQQNATVNLDPNISSMQGLKIWPEFHNAVAAGLKLSPLQGKVTRTWIIYNQPHEPSPSHAGLLLAIGMNGFLRVLSVTDIYSYYTQGHESTTVGLMLGLAASYRGTMQPAISKSLYFHVASRHTISHPEVELPNLMQSAALVAVGLLYEGSVHPQIMQTLMNEFGRRTAGENFLEREGHVLSAGFALGLVTLGHGADAHGSTENVVNQLLVYVGCRESQNHKSLFKMACIDEYNRDAGQIVEGAAINADVTSPGAIVALALMFLKTECEEIFSRISIPQTHFDLLRVRPNLLMLRVIACSLIMWSRVCPSKDWVHSQIPEVVKCGLKGLGDINSDIDTLDAETFVQAYVNIVTGACISLGLRFAGTKDANVQELLHEYAEYFLNEIKPVSTVRNKDLFTGLSGYIDRGTLETCLHLVVLSLTVVMAGSGHLKTFRFLRFLRGRNSTDSNYGLQMAVSMAIGFLFLGGGMRTFSTRSSAVAALLISLYPRLPTAPNDNGCHLQAFRHLYVLASEARWIQTVDIDSGQAVYVPIEITVSSTEHYSESSICEVTPCILPERSILKSVRVCGPRYWPQVIHLTPEENHWWVYGDKLNPFNSGILFVKRKFEACSYIDDPVGCQLLLSRAMQKVARINSMIVPEPVSIDNLVATFTSDPSLISFAQLCCNYPSNNRADTGFQEFCLQVLLECMSKDRPPLLQVYLSLYTSIGSMAHHLVNSSHSFDTICISNFKIALAYKDALLSGRLTISRGPIVQSAFLASLRQRLTEILSMSADLNQDLRLYLKSGAWPNSPRSVLLAWYLHWFGVPPPSIIKQAVAKSKPHLSSQMEIPLLKLLLPNTEITAIQHIHAVMSAE